MSRRPGAPLVSAVIPTRDRKAMLLRALDSVAGQTHPDIEVIVVDDASSERLDDVAGRYAGRFRGFKLISNPVRKGGAESRNIGVRAACGDYVAFLDDDDEWLPEKTARQVEALERDGSLGAVSCWYYRVRGNKARKERLPSKVDLGLMLWENFMGSFSFCMARGPLARAITIDPALRSSQDWLYWIELSRASGVRVVEDYLARHHEHGSERITTSYSGKYEGQRRVYLRYRAMMSDECRAYRLTYLMLYRLLGAGRGASGLIGRAGFFLGNRVSRFVVRKMLFQKTLGVFRLGRLYGQEAAYRFIRGI